MTEGGTTADRPKPSIVKKFPAIERGKTGAAVLKRGKSDQSDQPLRDGKIIPLRRRLYGGNEPGGRRAVVECLSS